MPSIFDVGICDCFCFSHDPFKSFSLIVLTSPPFSEYQTHHLYTYTSSFPVDQQSFIEYGKQIECLFEKDENRKTIW